MKTLHSRPLVLLISMSIMGIPHASYADDSTSQEGKGTRYKAEWKTLPALDSDYEVIQLTTSRDLDNKMYLDVNPYVPTLDSVVFNSERHDSQNLYLMSLENGSFVQLTDSDDIDGDHSNVSPATEEAFFEEGRTFKKVSLRPPYEETEIYTVEDKYDIKGIVSLSSDGKTIASSLHDEEDDRSTLVTIDVATGRLDKVKRIDGKVDHVLINPVHGDTLLYHVFDKNEIGIVDIDTKSKKVLTDSGDHGVHPFWGANGVDAAYALRKRNDTPEQVVTFNIRARQYVKYDILKYSNHFAMNPSQTRIQGDGSKDDPHIYYYDINPGDNKVDIRKMFKHRSSSEEEAVHPHAAFINDTDLIFNSDAGRDNGDVYLLRKKHD